MSEGRLTMSLTKSSSESKSEKIPKLGRVDESRSRLGDRLDAATEVDGRSRRSDSSGPSEGSGGRSGSAGGVDSEGSTVSWRGSQKSVLDDGWRGGSDGGRAREVRTGDGDGERELGALGLASASDAS